MQLALLIGNEAGEQEMITLSGNTVWSRFRLYNQTINSSTKPNTDPKFVGIPCPTKLSSPGFPGVKA